MNVYIVRHAEPDYARDTLTEKGWREAELLSRRLENIPNGYYYTSPLGRARDTASLTLQKVGAQAQVCPWLREFDAGYETPAAFHPTGLGWDLLPESWVEDPRYYDPERWFEAPVYASTSIRDVYRDVTGQFDAVLADHGYRREGHLYRVERPNTDNLFFFCHFGVECVLLSRLLDCSPVVLWHHTVALTSSVTKLTTEERREGKAIFRMSQFGSLSHLDGAGEEPSFFARFCETCHDGTRED